MKMFVNFSFSVFLIFLSGSLALKPCTIENENGTLHGVCVSFKHCVNGTLNTYGSQIFIPRTGVECESFEQCCLSKNVASSPKPINAPRLPPSTGMCGVRNPKGVDIEFVGDIASKAQFGEFPWMVALLKLVANENEIFKIYKCGGSLIHAKVVLTASHCVDNIEAKDIIVRAGEYDALTEKEPYRHVDAKVEEIVLHEDFFAATLFNDIALMFLEKSLLLSQYINTVCLPPQNQNFDGSFSYGSGWGKDTFTKEGKYQAVLKKLKLPIVPLDTCQDQLRKSELSEIFTLHESFICAGGQLGTDMCTGDGGSPLIVPVPGNYRERYYQAGIVAWGMTCNGEYPGAYVNVAKFRNWIDKKFELRNLSTNSYTYKP